jgi:hypothetical protein
VSAEVSCSGRLLRFSLEGIGSYRCWVDSVHFLLFISGSSTFLVYFCSQTFPPFSSELGSSRTAISLAPSAMGELARAHFVLFGSAVCSFVESPLLFVSVSSEAAISHLQLGCSFFCECIYNSSCICSMCCLHLL